MDSENSVLNTPEAGKESENNQAPEKTSRWIGIICIVLFFVFGGLSICPWYLWIVFGLLAVLTIGGTYKWGQLFFGVILLIWGTSLFSDEETTSNDSHYEVTTSTSSDVEQSESERRVIEREIAEIEAMQVKFQQAWNNGDRATAKRYSDAAERKYEKLKQKNLTKAQRARLSDLFAL